MFSLNCKCSENFFDIDAFNHHLKCHIELPYLYYECRGDCVNRFHNLESFRCHLRSHREVHQNNGSYESALYEPNWHVFSQSECIKSDPNSKSRVVLKNETPILKNIESEHENSEIFDDHLEWFAVYQSAENSEKEKVNVVVTHENYVDELLRNSSSFISTLYNRPDIPRNVVHLVTEQCQSLFNNEPVHFLKREILGELVKAGASKQVTSHIETMFAQFQNSFLKLSTEWKRLKLFTENGTFTEPQAVSIGFDRGVKLVNHKRVIADEEVFVQFIPITNTLKQFLELPTVFDRVQMYITFLKNHSHSICNFMQGKLWATMIRDYSPEDIVLPLFFDSDDYESNNIAGSHSGAGGKLGALYVLFPFLPPELQAKLENIFLVLLYHANDRKLFGNKEIFKQVIEELKILATEGILIRTSNGCVRIYFLLALILGDNLGLNGIHGYVESFTGTNFCRICSIHHKEAGVTCTVQENLMRTKQSYENAVKSVLSTGKISDGVKEPCIWNELPQYHVTSNVCLDVLHDGPEGVMKIVILEVLNHFDKQNIVEILNDRLFAFDFGFNAARNKPQILDRNAIRHYKLRSSASETMNLMRYLGLLVGDLIPMNDEFWELYITLNEIFNIVLENSFQPSCPDLLKVLIEEHLQIFRKVVKKTLTPKQHFLLHYPYVMMQIGPMAFTSSIKGERKHKESKTSARASASRKNLPYTLALKHQLRVHHRLSKGRVTNNAPIAGPTYFINIEHLVGYEEFQTQLPCNVFGEIRVAKWIELMGERYGIGAVVVKADAIKTFFFAIEYIVIDGNNEIFFITHTIPNTLFDRHFQGFEIIDEANFKWKVVSINTIDYVTFKVRLPNSKMYIANKR